MRYSDRGMPYEDSAEYQAWEEAPSPKRGGKTVKTLLSVCMILLLLASLALLYIRQYTVTGASMEPTLMEGDRVFYVGFTKPNYGDLIIFDAGETYGLVIKRVVGLPGDVIQMTPDGHVIRNGQAQDESYLLLDPYGNSATSEITVEDGKLFVLGDNRAASIDSRDVRIGQIPIDSVRGVVTNMLRVKVPS